MILGLLKYESQIDANENDALITEAEAIIANPDKYLPAEEVVFA
jgi:hypothetical protein